MVYNASRHLATILKSFTGNTSSYVRDSKHFISIIKNKTIDDSEIMVSFDVESLFTNVPVDEVYQLISDILKESNLPSGYQHLCELCLKNGYFSWQHEYYLQIDGVAMGSPIAPVAATIFMEWVEKELVSKIPLKPRLWVRYVDDIFAIVKKEHLTEVFQCLNNLHRKVHFTMEEEKDGKLPFLDVMVMRLPGGGFNTTVYRKFTHTNRYLHASSHHHPSHLSSVPRSLINRALQLCDPPYVDEELRHVRHALEINGYKWRQSQRVSHDTSRLKTISVERSPIYSTYIKGITDKIGHYLRRNFNIMTRFRPPGQVRSYLRSPKDKDPLDVPGVYMIPCTCGMNYIGETSRNIKTRLMEHIRCVKNVDTNSSAVAEHIQDSGTAHYIRFDKATVLSREKFLVPRKIREAIEICRFPNFNRDKGWCLPAVWKPLIHNKIRQIGTEPDTVSIACLENSDSVCSVEDDAQSDEEPSLLPTQPSERARRQARRAAAREVDSSFRGVMQERAHD